MIQSNAKIKQLINHKGLRKLQPIPFCRHCKALPGSCQYPHECITLNFRKQVVLVATSKVELGSQEKQGPVQELGNRPAACSSLYDNATLK